MDGVLAAIEAVDWSRITHCFGAACDLPESLREMFSPDGETRRDALVDARELVNHQGDTCEASLYVVPFLVEGALHAPGDREAFVYWLAWSCDLRTDAQREHSGYLARVRDAVAGQFAVLAPLLGDSAPKVRRAMLMLAAACPRATVEAATDLRVFADEDDMVRADLLAVLGHLYADWPGLKARLREALADDFPAVRYQAARVLMRRYGPPFDDELVTVLADVLARHGIPGESLDAIEGFCAPPEPGPAQDAAHEVTILRSWPPAGTQDPY